MLEPSTTPGARSAPTITRLSWLKRWIWAGPAPKLMSAITFKGTVAPVEVGTGRFSIVERFWRDDSSKATRIGTWRSDKEKRALAWSISPWVATRIAWL